ncbi:dienelactone hydrolase [Roseateles sp. DAIF2]|uniref:dienelactone hydrolase family protein n=1 Tax=Roseateles sp. DAIF2 TaxID=2714952 RepID=UPI0018A308BC|nr:dienelactone hydrolase family protein [Roseateles sp. DAIF2]QPF72225.1 dienelactone hydrolase [Roseateles sp. DAIF2]
MRVFLFFLILIALAGGAQAASPASPSLGITPAAGPHAVGLRVVQQYDYSRVLAAPVDAFGQAGKAGPARPIQTLVWYPAQRSRAAPMRVADYLQASLSDVDFAFPKAEAARQRAGWMAGPQRAQFGAPTRAVRDAAAAGGRYPVLIYAPSFGAFAHENLDLCEYLASHGYVVLASPSLGARSIAMSADNEGVEAQAADIAFLAHYAQSLPQADITRLAAVGFSWGGMANVFAAARSNRIKALVSLDGSIRFFPKIWSAAGYVRPASTAVPLLFLAAPAAGAKAMEIDDASYLGTMKYSDVYAATLYPLTHGDFSSWHLRFAPADVSPVDARLQAYRSAALYTRRFLDAYLKNDASALEFLQAPPAQNGIGSELMSMAIRPASFVLLGEADFLRAFAKAGYRNARDLYTQMSARSPDFRLSPANLNQLGAQLLQAGNARGAVELFQLATHIEPGFASAFDGEGAAYESLGETALAIAAYEKAVAADKNQGKARARIEALRAGGPK